MSLDRLVARALVRSIAIVTITKTGDTTYNNIDLDDAIFLSFVRFFRVFLGFFVQILKAFSIKFGLFGGSPGALFSHVVEKTPKR